MSDETFREHTDAWTDRLINSFPYILEKSCRRVPDFGAIGQWLGQIGSEERVLVVEIFHGRFVTAEDIKRLNSCMISIRHKMGEWERENTSETDTFIMRFIVEKLDDLTGEESSRFADADLEFARRTLGNSDIAIVLRELDGESFYH